jgi:hypothetical protein
MAVTVTVSSKTSLQKISPDDEDRAISALGNFVLITSKNQSFQGYSGCRIPKQAELYYSPDFHCFFQISYPVSKK